MPWAPGLRLSLAPGIRTACAVLLLAFLAGCAGVGNRVAQRIESLLPADAILLGERHDAGEHQQLQAAFVIELARRAQLAALVLEMAERGSSTTGLPHDASEAQVRTALQWNAQGWPWERYRPVVMAAVARGVPVLGANLPRDAMRAAMQDRRLDQHLGPAALSRQLEAIRLGHCDLLPDNRLMPMARIQLARDASMAATMVDALQPGKTVLLVAGGGHVARDLGIPTHLPARLQVRTVIAVAGPAEAGADTAADLVWTTPALAPRDYCAEMKQQLRP